MEEKKRKKIGETKIGQWLKDKAPNILEKVGDILPDKGALGIVKNLIDKEPNLSEEDKEFALQLIQFDISEQENVSKRWEADMHSDSWLSKNVRPIVLMASWIILILLVLVAWFGVEISDAYISMFEMLAVTVNAAYFGGRTYEKYALRKR